MNAMLLNWESNVSFLIISTNSYGSLLIFCIFVLIYSIRYICLIALTLSYEYFRFSMEILYNSNQFSDSFVDRLLKTVGYVFEYVNNFLLMLLLMTLNGFVILSVINGIGIGYLLFRSKSSQYHLAC
ncbi:hypothetical protein BC833DRAFT_283581 [Globomyces pollinis-pini]|nr:hypothetical protein BC833DRAFT_283581 [Globomyces pollinis-pini]